MQSGNTKPFIFDVRYLVSYRSGLMTLAPGDLIATGTPPGVGLGKKPPVFLQPGDVVTMEITGLGRLENPVKRSEEHTSELQSQSNLVCRLLLEKKKKTRPAACVYAAADHHARAGLHTCPHFQHPETSRP